jgi:hypothetical protein
VEGERTQCWRRTSSGGLCGRDRGLRPNGDSGHKVCAGLNGYYGGRPRMPLLPLVAEEQRLVEELSTRISCWGWWRE